MDVLREVLKFRGFERGHQLRKPETEDALAEIGYEAALIWLETHLDSPIGPEWGMAMRRLDPCWTDVKRWMYLSKEHCLVAVDALAGFADAGEFPRGGDQQAIHRELALVLSRYGNPRLKRRVHEIRRIWPTGEPRRRMRIRPRVRQVATNLLNNNVTLLHHFQEDLAAQFDRPETDFDFWWALIVFCNERDIVAIVRGRDFPSDIVAAVRSLPGAAELRIDWDQFATSQDETEVLLANLGREMRKHQLVLLVLEAGIDDYPLTILPPDTVEQLQALLAAFGDNYIGLSIP